MLIDGDERVRLSAVRAIEHFDFEGIVQKLGSRGGVSEPGSVLYNLADRVKDRKHSVRLEAMKLIGKIWGIAAGAIAEGSERITILLSPIPSKILDTYYINDPEITALADRVFFESLFPLSYPPIKAKPSQNGASQRVKDSQANGDDVTAEADIDRIRAERGLILVRDLESKAKKVMFARQGNQAASAKFMNAFLKQCEEYNGGVTDKSNKEAKEKLGKLIDYFSKTLPESTKASEDLWKFAKIHDRRSYQLIRFCMAPESDYRKVYKALKEFTKRMDEASGTTATMLDNLTVLLYRASVLFYNRSHVPAILEFSRNDEKALSSTAHDILREISAHNPEVFKAHVQELCRSLETDAPSTKKPNGPGAVEDLKACAGFARRFPKEIPKDRKFLQAMLNFALYGSPPKAAKYAVTILIASADKKEMYTKDIFGQCTKKFEYGSNNYLSRLAALSQLVLLSPKDVVEDEVDDVIDIAINQVLLNPDASSDPILDDSGKELEWAPQLTDATSAK
ncbi:hypothetical protein LTS18_012606, partial [Coniosporium uncinatum]